MNSILDRIKRTLDQLVSESNGEYQDCYFGLPTVSTLPIWNYFIFRRKTSSRSARHEPIQTEYEINIIHENYIPDGYIDKVIEALETKDKYGTKLKLCSDNITYSYVQKGNTDCVIEVATIVVTHPERR